MALSKKKQRAALVALLLLLLGLLWFLLRRKQEEPSSPASGGGGGGGSPLNVILQGSSASSSSFSGMDSTLEEPDPLSPDDWADGVESAMGVLEERYPDYMGKVAAVLAGDQGDYDSSGDPGDQALDDMAGTSPEPIPVV